MFLKAYIENDNMIDTRRKFNRVLCPNDPNLEVKALVSLMAHSNDDFVRSYINYDCAFVVSAYLELA